MTACIGCVVIMDTDWALPPRISRTTAAMITAPRNGTIGHGRPASSDIQRDAVETSIVTRCVRSSGISVGSPKSGTRLRKIFYDAVPFEGVCPIECLKRPSICGPWKVTLATLPASS